MTDETPKADDDGSEMSIGGEQATYENANEPINGSDGNPESGEEILEAVVIAEAVETDSPASEPIHVATVVSEDRERSSGGKGLLQKPPPIPQQFQNLAANGGAVTALALGGFAMVGAFFSDISAFNALMGLCFGAWGANSNLKRTNAIGLTFCVVALIICVWNLINLK